MALDHYAVDKILNEPPELQLERLAAVKDQLGVLSHGLDTLSEHCRHSVEATQALNTVHFTFNELHDAVADMWGGKKTPRPDRPTACSAEKAREVFCVSELLEHILLEIHPLEILNFAGVNRRAYDIVAGSSVLQQHMNLLPAVHARTFFTLPKLGFRCTMEPKANGLFGAATIFDGAKLFTVVVNASFATQTLPLRLGRRIRDMFICQPPIYEMRAMVTCCKPDKHYDLFGDTEYGTYGMNVPRSIYSETGITVGDLYDATRALIKEHCLCPAAGAYELDDDGFVKVHPTFEATIQLQEGDPLLFARRHSEETQKVEMQKRRVKLRRLAGYAVAKVAARDAGERIPTLAEFEASGTEDDCIDEESS